MLGPNKIHADHGAKLDAWSHKIHVDHGAKLDAWSK